MCHDSFAKVLKLLVDTAGRPIWIPTLVQGIGQAAPDTLHGKPVYTNNSLATLASGSKSMAFGAWRYYTIRDVNSVQLFRNDYLLGQTNQIAFFFWFRTDADLVCADNNVPIGLWQMGTVT